MKFKGKTVLVALLGGLICALTILLLAWIDTPQPSASEHRDVELKQRITGSLDTSYDLTIDGTLPGDQPRAFISLDARNRHATINSLQLPGNLESLYIDEKKKLAYLANSFSGLQIVDISDPLQLRLRGSLPDLGTAWDIVVQDSVLFLASAQSGLYLIDIRSAENPSIISHLSFKNQSILKLAVSNQTVYASTGNKGLLIIDITDLTSPRLVNTLYAESGVWGLLTEQNRMYLSCGKYRLEVLDLSSPENPRKIGELAMPGMVWDMRIVEKVLYLPIPSKALQLIDVSNAYQPKRLESPITLMHPNSIDLHQNRAYILSRTGGMSILDLSLPEAPKLTGTFNLPHPSRSIAVLDQNIYLASGVNGLQILKTDQLVSVKQIKSVQTPGIVLQVLYDDSFFYLATKRSGVHIAKRESSGTPGEIVAVMPMPGSIEKMVRIGDYLFLACLQAGLQIVNISDPTSPTRVDNPPFTQNARDITTIGNLLFLADYNQGIILFDVNTPENPVLLTKFPLQNLMKLAVDDRYLYAATAPTGLHILDYSTTNRLHQAGKLPLPWPLNEFADINYLTLAGTTLYMAAGPAGLLSFNIENPALPKILEIINLNSEVVAVSIDLKTVVATTRQGKLYFMEKGSDKRLSHLTSIDTTGVGYDVIIDDDQLIIANGMKGLILLPLPQPIDIENHPESIALRIPPQSIPGVYNLTLTNDGEQTEFIGAVILNESQQ